MARPPFTTTEAAEVAKTLGIDFERADFSLESFTAGMNVELEHGSNDPETDITGDDPILTGKVAWAHLKEFGDYYERLAVMEAEAEGKTL